MYLLQSVSAVSEHAVQSANLAATLGWLGRYTSDGRPVKNWDTKLEQTRMGLHRSKKCILPDFPQIINRHRYHKSDLAQ